MSEEKAVKIRATICAIGVLTAMVLISGNVAIGQDMLANKSRIVFLGDSITQAGVSPKGYVTLFKQAISKQYPDRDIEIIGAGISGNKVPDLQARLQRDVLSKNPTLVVIYIGINDVWHSKSGRGTTQQDFESGLREIVEKIQAAGSKVIVCTPSTIGEKTDGSNELDPMLTEFSAISRKVAHETNASLLDLRKRFLDYLKTHNPNNEAKNVLTGDGVHLNQKGNEFVAEQMLDAIVQQKNDQAVQSVVRHIVMFQFKPSVNQAAIDEIVTAFGKLPEQIDGIIDYEAGTNVSPENLGQGYTHAFVVTFPDAVTRDAYLPHPAHQAFVKLLDGKIESVLVFDYESQ